MNKRDRLSLSKAIHRHVEAHKALIKLNSISSRAKRRKEITHSLSMVLNLVDRIILRSQEETIDVPIKGDKPSTNEQLEELLGKVREAKANHYRFNEHQAYSDLLALAPSLARKVIAAEKMVEANGNMEEAIRSFLAELRPNCPLVPKEIHEAIQSSRAALTAYCEASK